jgi:hypothetical protein
VGPSEFESLPLGACWQHRGLRAGYDVVYFRFHESGVEIKGATTGLQEGETWIASYYLRVDIFWRTRFARIAIRTMVESFELTVESVGDARW